MFGTTNLRVNTENTTQTQERKKLKKEQNYNHLVPYVLNKTSIKIRVLIVESAREKLHTKQDNCPGNDALFIGHKKNKKKNKIGANL